MVKLNNNKHISRIKRTKNLFKGNIKMVLSLIFLIGLVTVSCKDVNPELGLKQGVWRGQISTQGNDIPFNFDVTKEDGAYQITLINGLEKLDIDEIDILEDSLFFDMHIFDISVKAKIYEDSLVGSYTKNYAEDYVLPFKAFYGQKGRFDNISNSNLFDGSWETTFKDDSGKETSAIGIFKKEGESFRGTFLSKTGDYRYLDGYTVKDTMYLYTFDGNHIYKFRAYKENDTILKGEYWSGKTSYKTFISRKNDTVALPDANSLTYLKDGFDKVDFSFPDLNGNLLSPTDEKYKGKVVILQILGTWCPNCMDETRFLSDWYHKNQSKGVEIIGLASVTNHHRIHSFILKLINITDPESRIDPLVPIPMTCIVYQSNSFRNQAFDGLCTCIRFRIPEHMGEVALLLIQIVVVGIINLPIPKG